MLPSNNQRPRKLIIEESVPHPPGISALRNRANARCPTDATLMGSGDVARLDSGFRRRCLRRGWWRWDLPPARGRVRLSARRPRSPAAAR